MCIRDSAHTGLLYCHLCQRNSGFIGSHCSSKKDFVHLRLCIGGKYLLCLAPVSYTHLDVYKRQEAKAGKIEYRLDKTNIIHCPIGKASFGVEKLQENFETLMGAIVKAKPAAAKGQYVKSCVLATTMGPGVKVNPSKFC